MCNTNILLYFIISKHCPYIFKIVYYEENGEEELFTQPCVEARVKSDKGGEVYALSYCNIHGLWENSAEI